VAAAVLLLIFASWRIKRAFDAPPHPVIASTIVLSDLANDTGDPSFDRAFRQTVSFELQHGSNMNVLQDARAAEILGEMRKAPGTRLTPDIAREICERTGSAAFIEGNLSKAGAAYLLTLRARGCANGDSLDEEQAQAAAKDDVFNQLRSLAAKLRSKSGASIAALQNKATPLLEATTSSLDALKSFSVGRNLLLERAVELDPKFALAYAWLGRGYADSGQQSQAMDSIREGYRLRGLASDQENFFITYNYDKEVLRNLELCRQLCEAWIEKYPRDFNPHGFLSGMTSKGTGRYQKAIEEGEKAIVIDSNFTIAYNNVAEAYLALNQTHQVQAMMQRAEARKISSKNQLPAQSFAAFLDGDQNAMARAAAAFAAASRDGAAEHVQALMFAYHGQLQPSRQASDQAVNLARQAHYAERAAVFEGAAAIREAIYGYPEEVSRHWFAAKQLASGRDMDFPPPFALALSGKTASAVATADRFAKEYPEDTIVQSPSPRPMNSARPA
jgi:hypothetical protein